MRHLLLSISVVLLTLVGVGQQVDSIKRPSINLLSIAWDKSFCADLFIARVPDSSFNSLLSYWVQSYGTCLQGEKYSLFIENAGYIKDGRFVIADSLGTIKGLLMVIQTLVKEQKMASHKHK